MYTETAELYDLFYEWKDYTAEAQRIRDTIEARRPTARTLLDVACGTGAHLDHLRIWYEVEGLDLDEGLLAIARQRLPDVPLQPGDMRDFDLGRQFDVVTCLFSSIGYAQTLEGMGLAIGCMARHVAPGGLLIVEPWFGPATFDPSFPRRALLVERPDFLGVRVTDSRVDGNLSIMDFHYLLARAGGRVEHSVETHALGLFTDDQYRAAFETAGLTVEHDAEGLMGRGLWTAVRDS